LHFWAWRSPFKNASFGIIRELLEKVRMFHLPNLPDSRKDCNKKGVVYA
jgi:hypothetical protein